MLTLVCAVVGEGRPFPVEIDAEKIVGILKKKIKEEKSSSISCDADALELYLALKNGVWLSDEDPVFDELKKKGSSDLLDLYMKEIPWMKPIYDVDDYFGSNPPQKRRIHVLVVVPSGEMVQPGAHAVSHKLPHPKRKARWDQLNEILADNKKKSKLHDSTAYSYVTWSDVKKIFRTTPYTQPHKSLPDSQLDFLARYLSVAMKCFRPITLGNEAQRLHVIAPILICVCFLFNGDVVIEVEEDLNGEYVKAHGHFEFVLRRGKKKVCIVEAKKDDLMQGMAQDLLGCEVQAEIGQLDVVYGIVTNYVQWNFLRSLNDKIELEECSLELGPIGPDMTSLGKIVGKIYAMLSDE